MESEVYHQAVEADFSQTLCRVLNDLRAGCLSVQVCVTASKDRFFDPKWDSLDFQPKFQKGLKNAAKPGEVLKATWEGRTFSCVWQDKRVAHFLCVTRCLETEPVTEAEA